jgi:transcriptional regulator with XRE-family HTH domain
MFNQAVAVYFRELREGQGFTQESLADAANCSKRTIERIERNEGPVTLATLERLVTALGASPDEVNYLMTHESATEHEARELARALLQRDPTQRWPAVQLTTTTHDPGQLGIQTYVRTLCERQGMSRRAIADKLGVLIATYADWEAGHSTTMTFPVLMRLATYVGGTLGDLQQIALADDGHERLGRRLAEERFAAIRERQRGTPPPRTAQRDRAFDGNILRRLLVIEGLLHYVLSLLKRALPGDVAEIERTSAHWLQLAAIDEEPGGLS